MAEPARLRVLLVEDTARDARLIEIHLGLSQKGPPIELVAVGTLVRAEEAARHQRFDCALLDLGLPDSRGVQNVTRLRAANPEMAIVVLTGLDDDRAALEALREGAQEYLVKGRYENDALRRVIQHAVERNQLLVRIDRERQHHHFHSGHDALTGLANRGLFVERARAALAQTVRRGEQLALCYIDLDGFKAVNDRSGHAIGDALLQAFARVLAASVRESDDAARLGGDEFAALFWPVHGPGDVEKIVHRIVDGAGAIEQIGGHAVKFGLSAGIALYPQHGDSVDALLRHADAAMYGVKRAGKGAARFYEPAAAPPGAATPDA